MADDVKLPHLEDDTLYALRTQNETDWAEYGELAEETYNNWLKYNDGTSGIEAKSWQDSGRGCIRCSGSLKIIEETEEGYLLLQCNYCAMKQWESDTAPDSLEKQKQFTSEAAAYGAKYRHLPDEIFRKIPDSLVLSCLRMREQELARKK